LAIGNKMANRDQFKTSDFINAIPGTGGIISAIAKKVGCDWHTAKKYVTDYPTVKQAYEDECAGIDDMAVNTVLKAIKEGDVSTAKWWLAKKRKAEFGEAIDVTSGGEKVEIVVRYERADRPDAA
jgi:hypothetical protein